MANEQKNIIRSLYFPLALIALLWVIKLGEIITHTDLAFLGVLPQKLSGLPGILTAPLIHGSIKHISSNSVPLFVLTWCLFYFYRPIAVKTFLLIWVITGLCVWVGGREAYHIGASGVIYGLAGFLFFSGIFRKDIRLLAITMLVTFLYGSLVWGIFPDFFPEENISFESHFWGLVTGIILAFYFRKEGPKRKIYDWEWDELLEDDDDDERNYRVGSNQTDNEITIKYVPPDPNKIKDKR